MSTDTTIVSDAMSKLVEAATELPDDPRPSRPTIAGMIMLMRIYGRPGWVTDREIARLQKAMQ